MKAIEQYKELIGIDSTNDNYYRWLAKAQEKEKLFKDARENYEILQKKDPKNSSLQIRIAYCLKNEEERFLIDGSNVCRSFLPTGRSASINVLLSLLSEIINGGNIFFCIFDANMRYVLRNNHEERKAEEVYVSLLKNYSKFFNEVPGGTRADSFILQISNRTGERIITNDTFKKDSSNISKKYPWITSNTKRLIKGKVMDNHIIIPDLSIGIHLENNTISLFGNFKKLLNARIDSK